jgi:N-sulfoglucosamine sulfohydrolase
MRGRLEDWMRATDDPLLDGPVEPPPGAEVNEPWQVSPDEPTRTVRPDPTAAPSR